MAKQKVPQKYLPWIEARKRYSLSHIHTQMAQELGLNPKKFGKLDNHKQEQWKAPLPEFIERIYCKRFGRKAPLIPQTIEQIIAKNAQKKAERQEKKALKKACTTTTHILNEEKDVQTLDCSTKSI